MDAQGDRRSRKRYPVHWPLAYVIWQDEAPLRAGNAMTLDLGTDAVSFLGAEALPIGAHLRMVIDWPLRHEGVHPVELYASGIVIRSGVDGTTVAMNSKSLRVNVSRRLRPE